MCVHVGVCLNGVSLKSGAFIWTMLFLPSRFYLWMNLVNMSINDSVSTFLFHSVTKKTEGGFHVSKLSGAKMMERFLHFLMFSQEVSAGFQG